MYRELSSVIYVQSLSSDFWIKYFEILRCCSGRKKIIQNSGLKNLKFPKVSTIHSDFGDPHMVPSLEAGKAVVREKPSHPQPGAAGAVIGSSLQRRILCRAGDSAGFPFCAHGVTAHQGQNVIAGKSHSHGPKMELLQSPA